MRGQRGVDGLAPGELANGCIVSVRLDGGILARSGFEFFELKFHPVEQLAATFRESTKPIVLQAGDHQRQMRDHRLSAAGMVFGCPASQLFGPQGGAKRIGIGRNRFGHANDSATVESVSTENEFEKFSSLPSSTGFFRPPCSAWMSPIDPLERVVELGGGNGDHTVGRRWPDEPTAPQPLRVK